MLLDAWSRRQAPHPYSYCFHNQITVLMTYKTNPSIFFLGDGLRSFLSSHAKYRVSIAPAHGTDKLIDSLNVSYRPPVGRYKTNLVGIY